MVPVGGSPNVPYYFESGLRQMPNPHWKKSASDWLYVCIKTNITN